MLDLFHYHLDFERNYKKYYYRINAGLKSGAKTFRRDFTNSS